MFPLNNGALGNFDQEILALLLKREEADWRLLHWAGFCGHKRVVQRQLEKGGISLGRVVSDRQCCLWQL